MSTMRHPFAYSQYVRHSRSTDTWLRTSPDTPLPPPLPPPQTHTAAPEPEPKAAPPVRPPLPRFEDTGPQLDTDAPSVSSKGAPGHFVKHSSRMTLLLSGQDEYAPEPEYTNGGTIEGILAVPRPSGLLSLRIKVEGTIKLKEVAGSGTATSEILNDQVFEWDAQRHASFPSKVTFRYTLPTHCASTTTSGAEYRLPPSYRAHLAGVPGFKVDIAYAIVVYVRRARSKANLWRGGTRLRVPFVYRELSRPRLAGPFSRRIAKTPTGPRTVWKYNVESYKGSHDNLQIELYLPNSQVCSMADPIPFCISLTAREEILAKYASFRPSLESFHPLASPDGAGAPQAQLFSCFIANTSPVRVHLHRQTHVDVLGAGPTGGGAARERTDIAATKALASGVVHSASRAAHAVVWSGHVVLPDKVRAGGFAAPGVRVTDALVLTLAHPVGLRADYPEFYESVPVRLTTETYEGSSGMVTVSDWSV